MSGYQQKDGQGALFKNDKGGNEARPDYRGSVTINGTEYELAAWIKDGQKGKFMSLSAKPKEDRQVPARAPAPPSRGKPSGGGFDDLDSDIPF